MSKKTRKEKLLKEVERLQNICIYENWKVRELFFNSQRKHRKDLHRSQVYTDLRKYYRYKVIPEYVSSEIIFIISEMNEQTKKMERKLRENCNRTYSRSRGIMI